MNLKGIIDIDFINYKKTSMVLEFPKCNFKCDKECGKQICQNSSLASAPTIFIQATDVIQKYLDNPVTQAVVMQGLEPFDSLNEMYYFIQKFRLVKIIMLSMVQLVQYAESLLRQNILV